MYRAVTKKVVQRNYIFYFATILLAAINCHSAIAFNIKAKNGATSYYDPVEPYPINSNKEGITYLNPRFVAGIKPNGFKRFEKLLAPTYDSRWRGWNFTPAKKDLYGNFEVKYYYACGAKTYCAKNANNQNKSVNDGVGAYIDIKYNPAKTDPKPGERKIYWIQFVTTNHSQYTAVGTSITGGVHGVFFQGLDIPLNQGEPYYRGAYSDASGYGFFDRPYRLDNSEEHYWYAEAYLVEQIAPKTVVVYNGIRWGWENRVYRRKVGCPNPNNTVKLSSTTRTSAVSQVGTADPNCPPPPSPPPPPPSPPQCQDLGNDCCVNGEMICH